MTRIITLRLSEITDDLRKIRLAEHRRRVDVQVLTEVNTMLFKILATPEH
jgi:hypothetical protein